MAARNRRGGLSRRNLPPLRGGEEAQGRDCKCGAQERAPIYLPHTRPLGRESVAVETFQQFYEQRHAADGHQWSGKPPGRSPPAFAEAGEDVCRDRSAGEDVEIPRQVLLVVREERREAAMGHPCSPRPRDRDHPRCGQPRRAFETPPHQRKNAVKLDLHRKRPQNAGDRAVSLRKPRVDEQRVRYDVGQRRSTRLLLRVAHRIRGEDAKEVRGNDLHSAPPSEVSPGWLRLSGERGSNERICDHEPAEKKEQVHADEAGLRHELEPGYRCREKRNFPNVIPQHQEHGNAA